MDPPPKCAAIAAAQKQSGLSYADIASKIGTSEARVTEIVTGTSHPTEAEFKSLSQALGIADVPHSGVHKTT